MQQVLTCKVLCVSSPFSTFVCNDSSYTMHLCVCVYVYANVLKGAHRFPLPGPWH